MTTNLQSARQAIKAELTHAKEGVAYYTARVQALESALQQLESVEGVGSASSKAEKPRKNAKPGKGAEVKRGRQARVTNGEAKRASANDLPSTGGEFWLKLIGSQPQSAVDISNAAIAVLGLKPDQKKAIQRLKQRVAPALAGLVSAHKIKDSGAGRERRFFKSEDRSA
jgi:hypothetical protein